MFLDRLRLATLICPSCKDPLNYAGGDEEHPGGAGLWKVNPRSASVDQFIPGAGYDKGNVSILCTRCNKLKSDFTDPVRFEQMALWMRIEALKCTAASSSS